MKIKHLTMEAFQSLTANNNTGCGYFLDGIKEDVCHIINTNLYYGIHSNGYLGNPEDPNTRLVFALIALTDNNGKARCGSPRYSELFYQDNDRYYTFLKEEYIS